MTTGLIPEQAPAPDAVLVPVKMLGAAKHRLAAVLPASDRRRLALAMLADVLRAAEGFPLRLAVTADPDAEAVGLALGFRLVGDPGGGLNAAVAAGTAAATAAGAASLLVLPADVPLATPDDLDALLRLPSAVVVVPSLDGGTNALLLRPPTAIEARFGPGSAAAHLAAARAAGLTAAEVRPASLALDVDGPGDLERLAHAGAGRESVRVAREALGVAFD